MGIGEKLKDERIKQGFTLQEVEEDTKIRKFYLEAIENDNYGILPPKVYATGFVRRYAKFLGLNEDEYAELFKQAAYGSSDKEELIEIKPQSDRGKGLESTITWKNVVVALVFLLVVIWVGDYLIAYFTKEHSSPPNNINQPIVEQPIVEEEKPKKDEKKPNEIKSGVEIIIVAEQNCWLNVVVDNESEYNAILQAGENLTFTGKEKIYLKAGNAGGIKITYNGEEMPPLGKDWEVKEATYTPLNI